MCSKQSRIGLGILPFLFFDGLFIALGVPARSAWPVLAAIFGFYFVTTIIAMYPGRTPSERLP